jgi:hypothetical protein
MFKNQTHYKLSVKLDTLSGVLAVSGQVNYKHLEEEANQIELYLHQDLIIENLSGASIKDYKFDLSAKQLSFLVHSRPLIIYLDKPIQNGEQLQFEIAYQGAPKFDENMAIGKIGIEYTELALYAPWFPVTKTFTPCTFDVQIETIPSSLPMRGSNGLTQTKTGWHIQQMQPSIDCCLIASKSFETQFFESERHGLKLQTSYISPSDKEVAKYLSQVGNDIVHFYLKHFGNCECNQQTVLILPRIEGGGYNRPGLVVLSHFVEEKLDSEKYAKALQGYYKYLAHELAHLWWINAPLTNWEDWLNESFAEYSSLLAGREVFGQEWFEERVEKYNALVNTLPPIWEIDRQADEAFDVLYKKGPALIAKWHALVGETEFINFMKRMHEEKIASTAHYLELVRHYLGDEVRAVIEADLKR